MQNMYLCCAAAACLLDDVLNCGRLSIAFGVSEFKLERKELATVCTCQCCCAHHPCKLETITIASLWHAPYASLTANFMFIWD